MSIFNFEFKGGSSFKFQATELQGINHSLSIAFPNGNILSINSNTTAQSYPTNSIGFSGQFSSAVLATFFELDLAPSGAITINTKQLREDVALYPEYFKTSSGNNAEFGYEYFPSGIYKITYSYTGTPTPNPGGGNITGGGSTISETKYILMDQSANICLKRKIEWLFENKLEGDTSQVEYDLVKNQIMQLIMMLHIAQFDYANAAYEEANLKLMSCDNICATGNLGYLYDSTRP